MILIDSREDSILSGAVIKLCKEQKVEYKKQWLEIGDYVMSARTGEKGKIHRTGVNYCIIVTEGGNMFREWVKDVRPINKP